MVDLFAALRGMFKPLLSMTDRDARVRGASRSAADLHRRQAALADPAELHFQCAQIHAAGTGARSARKRRGTTSSRSAWPTRASASPRNITRPFFRISCRSIRRCSDKWRGTGLGLSLSKKIAELLGGRVGMTSEPGVGSTFFVTIPIRFGEPPSETGDEPKPRPVVERKLHVD